MLSGGPIKKGDFCWQAHGLQLWWVCEQKWNALLVVPPDQGAGRRLLPKEWQGWRWEAVKGRIHRHDSEERGREDPVKGFVAGLGCILFIGAVKPAKQELFQNTIQNLIPEEGKEPLRWGKKKPLGLASRQNQLKPFMLYVLILWKDKAASFYTYWLKTTFAIIQDSRCYICYRDLGGSKESWQNGVDEMVKPFPNCAMHFHSTAKYSNVLLSQLGLDLISLTIYCSSS